MDSRENLKRAEGVAAPVPPAGALAASEKRMELLVEAVTDYALFMLDPQGFVMTWNPGAQRIKGYEARDIIGKHFSSFYPPEDIAAGKPERELKTALEEGRFEEEGWRLRKDQTRFWANVILTPVYDQQHVLKGFAKITRDFTERRSLEEALRQSEERFRMLVQSVKDYAIFMLDADGRVASWNEGAERAKGYKATDIIGRSFTQFYTPEDILSGKPQELLREAAEQGRVEVEGWRLRQDGSRFWADVTLTAIRDAGGTLKGFAKVTRDITERKRAEDALRIKQVEINQLQKIESLGRLSGGIAHDFNNLLTGILGCAEAIRPALSDGHPAVEDIAEIEKACERGRLLIQQLLAFSRRQLAVPKTLNLNSVIEGMKQLLQRTMGTSIELILDLAPDLDLIQIDVSQMEQIVMNLFVNARDAMPKGGRLLVKTENVWIDEYSVIDGLQARPCRTVALTIHDNGTGMSPEVQAKIFEPFFTTKPQGKGTGLGLSTVYGIVQQNKGGISVYSLPDMGTTFKIFMPANGSASTEGFSALEPSPEERANRQRGTELILIVEDEPLVLRNTMRALQAQGYPVLTATNADEALEIYAKARGKIQLLITDIIMPGRNGKELADLLTQQTPGLKVLFMSGYPAETIADHGIIQGDVDLVEKPFNAKDLALKVRTILDRPKLL